MRETVPPLEKDRYLAPDLEVAADLVKSRELVSVLSGNHMIELESLHAAG